MPTIDTRWNLLSHRSVILENRALRVVVLPELGGRIWSIVYKPRDRELLWHNPRIPPQKAPFGAPFDNVWCGAWEEMFPTPAPGVINGETYPDHGEVWSLAWDATTESQQESVTLQLRCETPISAIRMEKRITLREGEPRLEVAYSLTNLSQSDFPFLFALHPAFQVTPRSRLDFPPMSVELEPTYPGSLVGVQSPFAWPFATRGGKPVDLRIVQPDSSGEVYFFYGTNFREGWCAITDTRERLTRGLVFSPEVFRSCWLFATYGGWRNYHVAILEPCTSYPQQIEQAIQKGQASTLPKGGKLETTVVFQVQEGLSSVSGLGTDGSFREVPSSLAGRGRLQARTRESCSVEPLPGNAQSRCGRRTNP